MSREESEWYWRIVFDWAAREILGVRCRADFLLVVIIIMKWMKTTSAACILNTESTVEGCLKRKGNQSAIQYGLSLPLKYTLVVCRFVYLGCSIPCNLFFFNLRSFQVLSHGDFSPLIA